MSTPQVTVEKLLETIGAQTVELNLYRTQATQLNNEIERLKKQQDTDKTEEA